MMGADAAAGRYVAQRALGLFFLIAQVSEDQRDGILGFQRPDDIDRCPYGDVIKQLRNLRVIQHDTAVRLI